jgi:hypothetical protein
VDFRVEHPDDATHADEQSQLSDRLEAIVMLAIAVILIIGFLIH